MMASREENSVTPCLYAFKRWFTFMGCSSALPTILTTVQSYEHFLKYAIGISLFVLHPAVIKYHYVIHKKNFSCLQETLFRNCNTCSGKMYYILEVADHRPVIWALQGFCRAARTIFYVFTQ